MSQPPIPASAPRLQRVGTLACWLFGHKFTFRNLREWIDADGRKHRQRDPIATPTARIVPECSP